MKFKELLAVLCLMSLCPVLTFGTWVQQSSGTPLDLNTVFFIDSLYGWAAGGWNNAGIILRTTNSGNTWNTAYNNTQAVFQGAWFINRQTGWVVGGRDNYVVIDSTCQKILKTTDGGITWQQQWNRNQNTNWRSCYGVCFIGNTGWVTVTGWADSLGYIINTTDGGASWTNQSTGDRTADPWDIQFTTTANGVCSGGLNWGYPADNTDGHIWATSDGGTTWADGHNWRPGTAAMGFFTNVWMVNNSFGWSTGGAGGMSVREAGRVVRTTNGGFSWSLCNPPTLRPFSGVYFPDTSWGWIGAYGLGILFTSDGGRTWQDDNAGVTNLLGDIHGTNRRNAWAVGTSGTIIRYVPASGIEEEVTLEKKRASRIGLSVVPNPFTKSTKISFQLPSSNLQTTLRIYDATGSLVKLYDRETIRQSDHLIWDGRDESNHKLPGGIYFLEAKNGDELITGKAVIRR